MTKKKKDRGTAASGVTKLILAWSMYVTLTVHPTAWITLLFYCQIQQDKSQEVKLSFKKKCKCCATPGLSFRCWILSDNGKGNPFLDYVIKESALMHQASQLQFLFVGLCVICSF